MMMGRLRDNTNDDDNDDGNQTNENSMVSI